MTYLNQPFFRDFLRWNHICNLQCLLATAFLGTLWEVWT